MSRKSPKGRSALLFSIILLLGGAAVGAFAQAAAVPPAVSGTIVSISGTNVTLELADKTQKSVVLQDTTLVLERDAASLDQIRTGDAMGVTSHRSGTDMVASMINIFAREMKGVRMAEFVMASGDTMTNGTVTGYMQGMNGHTLTMTYPNGKSTIVVPDGIPIHRLVSVKRAALVPGMQIMVRGTADANGKLKAASVSFEGPVKG